jgi:clan AA aspartic protease
MKKTEQKGLVNEILFATIPIELSNGSVINCLLDTGFEGTLMLPKKFAEENFLEIIGQETFIAAERMQIQINSAVVEIKWFDDELEIPVFVSNTDDALIGVEMLVDSKLEIDYKKLTVKITK